MCKYDPDCEREDCEIAYHTEPQLLMDWGGAGVEAIPQGMLVAVIASILLGIAFHLGWLR